MARRRLLALLAALAAALPSPAGASELIARNATGVSLAVSRDGVALLTYRARGKLWHVLAWGAVNALPSAPDREQLSFRLDYSGGWGSRREAVWKDFEDACRPYDGPGLAWLVTACKAADGSYWALQSWQRALPDYGLDPTPTQAVWELRLSHWRGPLPAVWIKVDWSYYGRYDHLWGALTYRSRGIYGYFHTPRGVPLDTYGRNVYVDTLDSVYGPGWRRENSFLTHRPDGTFCYGFYPHAPYPAGHGRRYRATIIGPGVTPDVLWEGEAPGPFDQIADLLANREQRRLRDPLCTVN